MLLRTKLSVEGCEEHLLASKAFGTEVESYLTQYLLVVLCSDVQQEIYRLTEDRAASASDPALSSYVVATARKVLRSVGKDEIAKFVGMFGTDARAKLNALVDDGDVTIYNNAVNNRHDVAHKMGTQVTFRELKEAVEAAERIIAAVAKAMT